MGNLYGTSFNIFDPLFGFLTGGGDIARQKALLALNTEPGSLDEFPQYGLVFDGQILRALDPTALAMLPLEVQQALEQEPAFTSATVTPVSQTQAADGGVSLTLSIQITGAEGDSVGFTVSTPTT